MYPNKLLYTLALFLVSTLGYSQLVTNESELNNAITAAAPGTTIILADGTWNDVFIDIDKNGTSANPITITAQNPGAVLMTGNSRVYMEGSYLIVSGLVFQDPANLIANSTSIEPVFELKECDNCQVINNKIDTYNGTESQKTLKFKWVYINDCQYVEIAYNSFIGKYGIGSIVNDNRQLGNSDYLKIHHNYFADRTPINGVTDDNNQDAIRIGTSTTSLSDSFSEVYENYFYNYFGEIEVISNKSGQNKYYNNTFRDYAGGLTLRHGGNCEVFGNYFFAENNFYTGGVRVIGEGHKVYNNYIEGINSFKPNGASSSVTGGINVMNGVLNSPLNGYFQVKNAQVINNTFVNCDYGLRIGTDKGGNNDQEPVNLTVANNIMYNTSIDPYQIVTAPSGNSVSEGNLTNLPNTDMTDDGNFHRLTSGSSPIDAGVGSYTYLTLDVLEGNRDADFDAGTEEFGANGTRLPYTAADVGAVIGFGALTNTNPLPVELIDFQAMLRDDHVLLKWSTASEINNDYFTIERSADGLDFIEIARVDGMGSTLETQVYSYHDYNYLPFISYYRLKQTDFDGSFKYGKIVSVKAEKELSNEVNIFPNPSSDFIEIQMEGRVDLATEINLFDIKGQLIQTKYIQPGTTAGYFDTQDLHDGQYIIQVKNGLNTTSHKITISHK